MIQDNSGKELRIEPLKMLLCLLEHQEKGGGGSWGKEKGEVGDVIPGRLFQTESIVNSVY